MTIENDADERIREKKEKKKKKKKKKTILGFRSTDFLSSKNISRKNRCVLPFFLRSDRRGTKKIFSKQTDLSLSASKY